MGLKAWINSCRSIVPEEELDWIKMVNKLNTTSKVVLMPSIICDAWPIYALNDLKYGERIIGTPPAIYVGKGQILRAAYPGREDNGSYLTVQTVGRRSSGNRNPDPYIPGGSALSVSEKSFPQSASPTLRYILPSFGCRSPLRRPHSDKISHKLRLAAHEKPFSDTL